MDTTQARQLVLGIVRTLQTAAVPVSVALEDLRRAMLDADAEEAFVEILQAWQELTVGIQRESDGWTLIVKRPDPEPSPEAARWPGLTERQAWAMETAAHFGKVANVDIREAFDVSDESARLDLVGLAKDGLLSPMGEKSGRFYVPNGTPG